MNISLKRKHLRILAGAQFPLNTSTCVRDVKRRSVWRIVTSSLDPSLVTSLILHQVMQAADWWSKNGGSRGSP